LTISPDNVLAKANFEIDFVLHIKIEAIQFNPFNRNVALAHFHNKIKFSIGMGFNPSIKKQKPNRL